MRPKTYARPACALLISATILCVVPPRITAQVSESDLLISSLRMVSNSLVRITYDGPPSQTNVLQVATNITGPFFDVPCGPHVADPGGMSALTADMADLDRTFFRVQGPVPFKSILTWSDLVDGLQGTFVLPMAEDGDYRFGYSSAVHAQLANSNLVVMGHPYYNAQGVVQLPDVLDGREATWVGPWTDFTQGQLPDGWSAGEEAYLLGGLLEITGRIYFTKNQWYNGAGVDWQTHGYYDGAYDGSGTATGMWQVAGTYTHHQRVGGYMSYATPCILADGHAYLAGLEGTSGAALGRWGPNLFAIDATPTNGFVPSRVLICHDMEAHQATNWWIGNKVTGAEWIETETRHGVVFFVYEGLGTNWYGVSPLGDLVDPYGGGSGYHAQGWVLKVWIYDPADLMDVYNGLRDPWSLEPVEQATLTERAPGSATETHYSFITGSAKAEIKISNRDGRLILLQPEEYEANEWERTPKGYVVTLP